MVQLDTGTRLILDMMHFAFVEIRATDNMKKARGIADILHNVPNMIARGRSAEKIVCEIKSKADRHEAWPLLESWFRLTSDRKSEFQKDFHDEWKRLLKALENTENAEGGP